MSGKYGEGSTIALLALAGAHTSVVAEKPDVIPAFSLGSLVDFVSLVGALVRDGETEDLFPFADALAFYFASYPGANDEAYARRVLPRALNNLVTLRSAILVQVPGHEAVPHYRATPTGLTLASNSRRRILRLGRVDDPFIPDEGAFAEFVMEFVEVFTWGIAYMG